MPGEAMHPRLAGDRAFQVTGEQRMRPPDLRVEVVYVHRTSSRTGTSA
jgi:hypothetical protein